jgi:hypothetical protein
MPGPLIFIATNRLKAGALNAERSRVLELVSFVERQEPQVIGFNEYVNDAGDEVTVVQIHPDAASFEKHMDVIADHARRAYEETLGRRSTERCAFRCSVMCLNRSWPPCVSKPAQVLRS